MFGESGGEGGGAVGVVRDVGAIRKFVMVLRHWNNIGEAKGQGTLVPMI